VDVYILMVTVVTTQLYMAGHSTDQKYITDESHCSLFTIFCDSILRYFAGAIGNQDDSIGEQPL